ncbi:FG-GAP repeat domain-containing protein [Paenibacillus sp. GCM10027627]|uniref:FG-GAP repeat domain-containing protein n=1 Tax=unclassified Paenibacillus TaxID=185978 RepID=UPI00363F4C5F
MLSHGGDGTGLPESGSGPRRSFFLLGLLALSLLVTGCRYTAAPADLLKKPAIAADKEQLAAAIERALPNYSMLMLPHQDDYKEAIRLVDMDGDGKEEAVVTYYNEYNTPEVIVLKETENGWRQSVIVEQPLARDMAWLKLADFDKDGHLEMLVGWVGAFDSPNMLELYSFQEKAERNEKGDRIQKPIHSLPYSLAETGDLDGDGLTELAVITTLEGKTEGEIPQHRFQLFSLKKGQLNKRINMALPEGADAFVRMAIGKVSERQAGIVLEGSTGAHSMLTYMYVWEKNGLRLVYPDPLQNQDGFSGRPTQSVDMNGDGIMELNWTYEAPGHPDVPYADSIWINEWMQWDGKKGFQKTGEQFLDYTYGVKVDIPELWSGRYSMKKPSASSYGIVAFEYWSAKSGKTAELATLYVVPLRQWGNVEAAWKDEGRKYRMLASASGNAFLVSFAVDIPSSLSAEEQEEFKELMGAEKPFPSYFTVEDNESNEWR